MVVPQVVIEMVAQITQL